MTYEEFKMWVERTPLVMDYIESILPYNGMYVCMYVCMYVSMYIWIRMYVCVYIINRYLLVGDGHGHRNSDCSIGVGHPDHDPGLERQLQATYSEE